MTLYAEGGEVFAPRPTTLAFAVTSFCLQILSAQLTTLGLSLVDAALAFLSQWRGSWFLYAPLADSFQHGLIYVPPAEPSYRLLPAVAAGLGILVSLLLVYFWPVDQTFFSLLAVQGFGLTLLTFGTMATAFEPASLTPLETLTGMKTILWAALLTVAALGLAIAIERRSVELTTNVFTLDSPFQRVKWWALRILPAFAVLAVLCFLNDYRAGWWAALSAIGVTMLENLSRVPKKRFVSLKNPRLREAAATLPIAAIALAAGSVYVFGMEAAGRPPKVLTLTRSHQVRLQPLARAREDARPIIDIRWSEKNQKPETRNQKK